MTVGRAVCAGLGTWPQMRVHPICGHDVAAAAQKLACTKYIHIHNSSTSSLSFCLSLFLSVSRPLFHLLNFCRSLRHRPHKSRRHRAPEFRDSPRRTGTRWRCRGPGAASSVPGTAEKTWRCRQASREEQRPCATANQRTHACVCIRVRAHSLARSLSLPPSRRPSPLPPSRADPRLSIIA